RQPADDDARDALLLQARLQRQRRAPFRQLADEGAQLLAGDAALQRDLLDLALAHLAREADQRRRRFRQPLGVDDDLVADEADDDGIGLLRDRRAQRGKRLDAALD